MTTAIVTLVHETELNFHDTEKMYIKYILNNIYGTLNSARYVVCYTRQERLSRVYNIVCTRCVCVDVFR